MIFTPQHVDLILAGLKTQTRRRVSPNRRSPWYAGECAFKRGDVIAIQPGRGQAAVAHAAVLSVRKHALGYLTVLEAQAEGYATVDEFRAVWAQLHGRFDPAERVWAIRFRLTKDGA